MSARAARQMLASPASPEDPAALWRACRVIKGLASIESRLWVYADLVLLALVVLQPDGVGRSVLLMLAAVYAAGSWLMASRGAVLTLSSAYDVPDPDVLRQAYVTRVRIIRVLGVVYAGVLLLAAGLFPDAVLRVACGLGFAFCALRAWKIPGELAKANEVLHEAEATGGLVWQESEIRRLRVLDAVMDVAGW